MLFIMLNSNGEIRTALSIRLKLLEDCFELFLLRHFGKSTYPEDKHSHFHLVYHSGAIVICALVYFCQCFLIQFDSKKIFDEHFQLSFRQYLGVRCDVVFPGPAKNSSDDIVDALLAFSLVLLFVTCLILHGAQFTV